jgi:hypothetical protein
MGEQSKSVRVLSIFMRGLLLCDVESRRQGGIPRSLFLVFVDVTLTRPVIRR